MAETAGDDLGPDIEARTRIADALIPAHCAWDKMLYIYNGRDDKLLKYLPTQAAVSNGTSPPRDAAFDGGQPPQRRREESPIRLVQPSSPEPK